MSPGGIDGAFSRLKEDEKWLVNDQPFFSASDLRDESESIDAKLGLPQLPGEESPENNPLSLSP